LFCLSVDVFYLIFIIIRVKQFYNNESIIPGLYSHRFLSIVLKQLEEAKENGAVLRKRAI